MEKMDAKDILKRGVLEWNAWRKCNPTITPALRQLNFHTEFPCQRESYHLPRFEDADFNNVDFHMSTLRNGYYINCCFDHSKITFADLVDAYFDSCSFKNVNFRVSKLGSATFINCVFENCDFAYCSAQDTNFSGSHFKNSSLEHMSLVSNDFTNTVIDSCRVYAISSWDLNLKGSIQQNLIITPPDQPEITVDNIELAQFMYLMINNARLRTVIDTITAKVVLILGNFKPARKAILNSIREKLRYYNLIPVIFDFDKPISRSLTETVFTLAHMAKFVIADLSSPRSIGHELSTIIRDLPSVNFYPLVVEGEKEYAMFSDFSAYPWVKPIQKYAEGDIAEVVNSILQQENRQIGSPDL